MEKYEVTIDDITLTKESYAEFKITKSNLRTLARIEFNMENDCFRFFDFKTNETIDLKNIEFDNFVSYFKKILGNKEIPIVLFNNSFMLNCKKDKMKLLYRFATKKWSQGDSMALATRLAKANLFFDFSVYTEKTFRSLSADYNVFDKELLNTENDDEGIEEFVTGYMLFKEHCPERIENKYGMAIKNKADKITNALYWGQKVTGLSYERVAEIYLDEKFKIDELPFCNNHFRITNSYYVKNKTLNKIMEIIQNNMFNVFNHQYKIIKNEEKYNEIRDFCLNYWIAYFLYYSIDDENYDLKHITTLTQHEAKKTSKQILSKMLILETIAGGQKNITGCITDLKSLLNPNCLKSKLYMIYVLDTAKRIELMTKIDKIFKNNDYLPSILVELEKLANY